MRFGYEREFDLDFGAQEPGREHPPITHFVDHTQGVGQQRCRIVEAAALAVGDAAQHLRLGIEDLCAFGGTQARIDSAQALQRDVLAIDLVGQRAFDDPLTQRNLGVALADRCHRLGQHVERAQRAALVESVDRAIVAQQALGDPVAARNLAVGFGE